MSNVKSGKVGNLAALSTRKYIDKKSGQEKVMNAVTFKLTDGIDTFLGEVTGERAVNCPTYDKNYFTQVDMRNLNSININVKNPKILSAHPTSSYKLVERGKIVEKLEITDPAAFWERSKFLVIVAD